MGLMDILNGMQNGPRGQRQPAPPGTQSGGMSPIMMALLGLLAYKAMQGGGLGNILGGGTAPTPTPSRGGSTSPPATPSTGNTTLANDAGLGDLLGGMLGGGAAGRPGGGGLGDILGGLLGGGAGAGPALGGGLSRLLGDLEGAGQGRTAQSWVGTGANQYIAPEDLGRALGPDTIDALVAQTGLDRGELLAGLSDHLPDLVDQLTPNGRMPTKQEYARW
jgi:uncharacterized protein YidB (DUF937 family)